MPTQVEFQMDEPNVVTGEKIWLAYILSEGVLIANQAFMCVRYDMVPEQGDTVLMGRRILHIEPGILRHWGLENPDQKFAWVVNHVENGTKTADEILAAFPNPNGDFSAVTQGLWVRGL